MTNTLDTDIHATTLLSRNSDIIASKIDNETVMMDIDFEKYYGLEEVGTRVWELLETQTSFDQLCEKLVCEFDVSIEQCKTDVIPFILDLIEQKMLSIQQV